MTEEKIQLIIGGLLHDIGKVIYRQGDTRKHSISGYDFLKNEVHLESKNVLEAVKYHHGSELKGADVFKDSFAYIVYIADNIASAADRRKGDREDRGFEISMPLESVFNILNGNDKRMYYQPGMLLDECRGINYPSDKKNKFDEHFYLLVKKNLTCNLSGMEWNTAYLNSLLEILEGNLSYVPSSTAKDELADISLYDHMKLTAAVGSCIYDFLRFNNRDDYKNELFVNESGFYEEKAFLLFSMDISGIQNFIYTIYSEGALKNLRARSFYLEIMMEHIVDVLLERLQLSRANLIYSGGGHCYMLLPNTEQVKEVIATYEKELNEWLMRRFDISLYVGMGYAQCSAADLRNEPRGSYADVFKKVGDVISEKKSRRYTPQQIVFLNSKKAADYTRECKICKRLGKLNEENECEMCRAIISISKNILYTDFFVVTDTEDESSLPLPFGAYLCAESEEQLKKRMQENRNFTRVYCKNKMFTGKYVASKLWVGNYTTGETFEELAKQSEGIKRIGILRADVDNLGKTFVLGFENEKTQDKYVTLSRTATLSRQLSLFFKYYINSILKQPKYSVNGTEITERKATIVYSGGDDLFIVGAWNHIWELAVDIGQAFREYTEGSLSISAGIGIYKSDFPIHVSADEVAGLEEDSKSMPGKNSVTFLPDGVSHKEYDEQTGDYIDINDATYPWNIFVDEVIGEKYKTIYEFLYDSEDYGKSFLYHMLELVRQQEDKLNLARFVYLLARMEPNGDVSDEKKQKYREFSKKMYQWIKEEKDCRQLKTAITLYSYMLRDKEETE